MATPRKLSDDIELHPGAPFLYVANMNTLITLGTILGLILTPQLPKLWQRVMAAVFTGVLGVGVLNIFINESQKANWAQYNQRIHQPTQQLLIDLRDGYGQDAPKTENLANHMINNWHRIGVAPWLNTVDDVRSEFTNRGRIQETEQDVHGSTH